MLIHGAWHGAWCWNKLVPILENHNFRVITPDLPGHGNDNTPVEQIGMDDYVKAVTDELDKLDETVILAGHSMAGMVITATAEQRSDKIQALVYITAFLPHNGKSLQSMEQKNPSPAVPPYLLPSKDGLTATILDEKITDLFYHDCCSDDIDFAKKNLCPQPLGLLSTPVKVSDENFGRIPRFYIECSEDRALCHEYQRIMIDASPGTNSYVLSSGHSPFFSMPHKLAEVLIQINR